MHCLLRGRLCCTQVLGCKNTEQNWEMLRVGWGGGSAGSTAGWEDVAGLRGTVAASKAAKCSSCSNNNKTLAGLNAFAPPPLVTALSILASPMMVGGQLSNHFVFGLGLSKEERKTGSTQIFAEKQGTTGTTKQPEQFMHSIHVHIVTANHDGHTMKINPWTFPWFAPPPPPRTTPTPQMAPFLLISLGGVLLCLAHTKRTIVLGVFSVPCA